MKTILKFTVYFLAVIIILSVTAVMEGYKCECFYCTNCERQEYIHSFFGDEISALSEKDYNEFNSQKPKCLVCKKILLAETTLYSGRKTYVDINVYKR